MPSPLGGIAVALLVGVRDFIPAINYDSFRSSGLDHLLAISGLHIGLFCFSVYGALRLGFALTPAFSQRFAVHKLAAIAALIAGGVYLCLSGFPVSAILAYLIANGQTRLNAPQSGFGRVCDDGAFGYMPGL